MISQESPLVLGSASPRRRELLTALRFPLVVRPMDVDETVLPEEPPQAYVERIARRKLAALLERESGRGAVLPQVMLVADTAVVLEQEILGKPVDRAQAAEFLQRLVGRTHEVLTCYGICLRRPNEENCSTMRTVSTRVTMVDPGPLMIRRYANTGEGLDKAGAYAVQGLGAFLVSRIDGSHSNVIGLPLAEVVEDLTQLGALPEFPESP